MTENQADIKKAPPWHKNWRWLAAGLAALIAMFLLVPSENGSAKRVSKAVFKTCMDLTDFSDGEAATQSCQCVQELADSELANGATETRFTKSWFAANVLGCDILTNAKRKAKIEERATTATDYCGKACDTVPGLREDIEVRTQEALNSPGQTAPTPNPRAPAPLSIPIPTEPEIVKRRAFTLYDYGQAPDDFVPPIPKDLPPNALHLTMEKKGAGALSAIEVQRFGPWSLTREYDLGSNRQDMLNEDLSTIAKQKPRVLVCKYLSARPSITNVSRHWYRTQPKAANPDRLRGRLSDHPVLVISGVRETCAPFFQQ